jgi:cytochrome d ubiquinol oxidase subunit I
MPLDLDAVTLSRIQFAFTIAFHIIFPAFTIGLASWLAVLELRWLMTGREAFRDLYRFWIKVFAISFGLGVVSGIPMSFQFGTNWSGFADFTGDVLGPLIAYEVVTAFTIEAGFLGIMLFGWTRVGDRLHFLATCMVALGTLMSAFWILSANSWMQTPDGYEIVDGRAVAVDWWRIVFNPSFPNRFMHMVGGAYLTTSLAVAGMSAFMLLRARRRGEPHERHVLARTSLSWALWFVAVFAPVQAYLGDRHGLAVLDQQPTKLAAIEANWETGGNKPLILFAWPDEEAEENRWEVAVPYLGSLILTHSMGGVIPGLKDVPPEERPPVWPVFFSFRIMVGLGLLMIGLGFWSLWLRMRGRLFDSTWFLRACVAMTPAGFLAVLFGWFTAEIGRQPYVVYGLLRTADAASPIAAEAVAASLTAFVLAYAAVFGAGTYYLFKILRRGPEPHEGRSGTQTAHRPKRPLSAADDAEADPAPAGG